jgi:hypothetical protein
MTNIDHAQRSMTGTIRYIEKQVRDDLFEIEGDMEGYYKTLDEYKKFLLTDCVNDDECHQRLEDYKDEIEAPMSGDELKEQYEKIINEYCGEVSDEIRGVLTFQGAEECSYIQNRERNEVYFIEEGARLEKALQEMRSFLKSI